MNETLAERLVQMRLRIGYSQQELGERAGIAQTQVSRYESGRAIPRQPTIVKLAGVFEVAPSWLRSGVPSLKPSAHCVQLEGDQLMPITDVDAGTQLEFLRMAANESMRPSDFLKKLLLEHRMAKMDRKVESLEKQLTAMTAALKAEK